MLSNLGEASTKFINKIMDKKSEVDKLVGKIKDKVNNFDPRIKVAIDDAKVNDLKANASEVATGFCFVKGTKVLTNYGLKSIEEIKVGDLVYSQNIETGEKGYKPVITLIRNKKIDTVKLTFNGQSIEATTNHLFWSIKRGWVEAGKLYIGEELINSKGNIVKLEAKKIVDNKEEINVYNIEVKDWHTYYVGNQEILVHNDCPQNIAKLFVNEITKNTGTERLDRIEELVRLTKSKENSKVLIDATIAELRSRGDIELDEVADRIERLAKGTSNLTDLAKSYVDDIVDATNNINPTKMNDLRLAIQNNKFSPEELVQINKKMSELGIANEFQEVLIKKIKFGVYLKKVLGNAPEEMVDAHAHHILYKSGNGAAQKALVKEGQDLLRKYGIDPIMGVENLNWAPNKVSGQHNLTRLQHVVDKLKEVDGFGGTREKMVDMLKRLGKEAARME